MKAKFLLFNSALILALLITGCSHVATVSPPPASMNAPTEVPAPTVIPSTGSQLAVAFVKDGNVQLWDEATGQIQIIINSGDVTSVTLSDDGQVIAFTRALPSDNVYGYQNSALWAVDRDGGNPRELVSAETLHQRLSSNTTDYYTSIAEMDWIPGTRRLIYSGMINSPVGLYSVAEDVYLVDTDTLSDMLLAPAGGGLRIVEAPDGPQFVPSPDGTQVALLSGTELSFVNVDGSNLRQAVLTYSQAGAGDLAFVPTGVWTQDSRTFLINAPIDVAPSYDVSFNITRVPTDGSPVESVAAITESSHFSVTFSPDGKSAAFRRLAKQGAMPWLITPLSVDIGPLAHLVDVDLTGHANLHWSPSGDAFVVHENSLWRLCPNATEDSQVCGDPIQLEASVIGIQWMDSSRFLFLTRGSDASGNETNTLFLASLDGTKIPIVTGRLEGYVPRYDAVMTQH